MLTVPKVNNLSQLHCTSPCVKRAPSVQRCRSGGVAVGMGAIDFLGVFYLIFCPGKEVAAESEDFSVRSLIRCRSYHCTVEGVNTELKGISACLGCSHEKSASHIIPSQSDHCCRTRLAYLKVWSYICGNCAQCHNTWKMNVVFLILFSYDHYRKLQ